MEALKDAIITATAASSTSDAEKPNMEKLRELIKDFFQSPEGRIIVNEAIEKFMSSPDGVSLVRKNAVLYTNVKD